VECPVAEPQNVSAKSGAVGSGNGQKWAASDSAGDAARECRDADNTCETADFSANSEVVRAGIEPATHGFSVPMSSSSETQKEPQITASNGDAPECLPAGCQQKAGHLDETSTHLLSLFHRLSLLEKQTFLRLLSEQVNGRDDVGLTSGEHGPAVPTRT